MERTMNREMDILVAERVMGYQPIKARWYQSSMVSSYDAVKYLIEDVNGDVVAWKAPGGQIVTVDTFALPPFSTTIAEAWRVVEQMTQIPHTVEEARRAVNTQFALWFDSANLWAMTGNEAAFAICQAALEMMQP